MEFNELQHKTDRKLFRDLFDFMLIIKTILIDSKEIYGTNKDSNLPELKLSLLSARRLLLSTAACRTLIFKKIIPLI